MRFIHTADIHLDSPLLNLTRYEGAPVEAFRSATRRAFENLTALALEERVDFVLVAGDLYDGECKDMNTPIAFRRSLRELSDAGIKVFIVQGNHDAQSQVSKAFRLDLPAGVHLFSTRKPETIELEGLAVAIHGQGFAKAATEDNLAAGYPDPVPHRFNIGVLHTNCGSSTGHDNYAPSSVPQLVAKGYDYWALGHVHKRQVLHDGHPHIVYPGNIQGRHIRETGAKGCVLVTVDDNAVRELQFHPVDVLRWEQVKVDATTCNDAAAVIDAVGREVGRHLENVEGRFLAVRVDVSGMSHAHRELVVHAQYVDTQIREAVVNRFDDRVWVEKIKIRTSMPSAGPTTDVTSETLSEFLSDIDETEAVTEALAELRAELDVLKASLPTDPRLPASLPELDDDRVRAALLDDAKQLLTLRLLEENRAK